jgi:hypothetical protein
LLLIFFVLPNVIAYAGRIAAVVVTTSVPPTTNVAAIKIATIARVLVLFIIFRHQALRWFYISDLGKLVLFVIADLFNITIGNIK